MQNLLTATAPVRLTRTLESKAGLNAGLNHRQENGLGFQSIFEATPPSWSGKMAATRDNPNLQYVTVQTLTLKANALKQSSNCCENTCKAESYVPTVKFVNLRVRKHCIFSSLTVPHILALSRTHVPLMPLHVTLLQCSPFLQPHHLERAARNHPGEWVLHQLVEWFETMTKALFSGTTRFGLISKSIITFITNHWLLTSIGLRI